MNVELRKRHRQSENWDVMILRMKKLLHFCTNVYEFSPGRLKKFKGNEHREYIHLTGNKDRYEGHSSNWWRLSTSYVHYAFTDGSNRSLEVWCLTWSLHKPSTTLNGTVSWDRFQKCCRKWTDLGLNKGRGWFLNFSEAALIFSWNKTSVSR